MKNVISLLLCTVFTFSIVAQEATQEIPINKRGYIGFSIGPAIPMGDFGSTDISGEYSGFAKTGFNIQLVNFGYRFGKNIGIAGMWSAAAFNLDDVALRNNAGLGSMVMDIDPWGFGAFMGGLLISIPSTVVDVDFRGMIGFSYGMSPEMRFSGYDENWNLVSVVQESGESYAFAYDLGVGLRFNVSRLINLNLFFDYIGSKHEFSVGLYSGSTYLGTSEFKQPMNHITITGGVGFRLN